VKISRSRVFLTMARSGTSLCGTRYCTPPPCTSVVYSYPSMHTVCSNSSYEREAISQELLTVPIMELPIYTTYYIQT
jgi:hypothetical protein